MTVSIEWFVMQNLSMNTLILFMATRLSGLKSGKGRVIAAAALGCGYAVCAYLPWGRFLLGMVPRTLICVGMTCLLCAGRNFGNFKRAARAFAFVWVSTLLLGGTGAGVMYMLGSRGYTPLAAGATAVVGTGLIVLLTCQRNRKASNHVVLLTVDVRGRHASFAAVVDTGNALVEPVSNLPVIVVERRMLRGLEKGLMTRAVPFTSVGGSGYLDAFAADAVCVDGKKVDALLAAYDGVLCMDGHALIPGRCAL